MSQRSFVWDYFEKQTNGLAKCKECCNTYSTIGSATSALRNHLMRKHPAIYTGLKEKDEMSKTQKPGPSRNISVSSTFSQPFINNYLNEIKVWEINNKKSIEVDKRICEMLIMDDLPFSHVEDVGFLRLLQLTSPCYKVKSRKFYRDLICEKIYDRVYIKIYSLLHNLMDSCKLSFTTDAWSDTTSSVSLLSLTYHGIDSNFKKVNYVLCAELLVERHTGEYLSGVFNNMLKKWGINENDVHCVLRDAGANIKKALFLSNCKNLNCIAHQIQLILKNSIMSDALIEAIINKCRKIATHFNHSQTAQQELRKIQERINAPKLAVVQDVPTRWNSTFLMLERMKELNESLCLYLSKTPKVEPLNAEDMVLIDQCIRILKPFEEATKNVSSEKASLSDVIPLTCTLSSVLNQIKADSDGARTILSKILLETEKRFDFQNNTDYLIATFLDPRYKSKFLNNDSVQLIKVKLMSLCRELGRETQDHLSPTSSPTKKKRALESCDDVIKAKSHRSLQDSMSCLLESSSSSEDESRSEKHEEESRIVKMLELYSKEKRIGINECPLSWWRKNKEHYNYLSRIAKSYLSCPSSSVASECLFSNAGAIYDEKRNKLQSERAAKLLFLKYNLPIIDFQYEF